MPSEKPSKKRLDDEHRIISEMVRAKAGGPSRANERRRRAGETKECFQKQQERIKELEKKLQRKNKPERIDWREKLEL